MTIQTSKSIEDFASIFKIEKNTLSENDQLLIKGGITIEDTLDGF